MVMKNNRVKTLEKKVRKRVSYYKGRLLEPVTQNSLIETFRALGLSPGDLVCVHSQFSALGYLQGGPEAFIQALEEVVTPSGTIMMPAFSMNDSMLSYLESGEVFSVSHTPSRVGKLTETFRTWPGVMRSLHPTNSVTAKGPRAAALLSEHERSLSPYGSETPFGRLGAWGGKILMVNTHVRSFLHHVQDLVDFPNLYLDGIWEAEVEDEQGSQLRMQTKVMRPRIPYFICLPGTEGFEQDYALLHDYALIFPESRESEILKAGYRLNNHDSIWNRRDHLMAHGIFRALNLGNARVGLLDAGRFLEYIRLRI